MNISFRHKFAMIHAFGSVVGRRLVSRVDFPVDMFGEGGNNMMMAMTYYIEYIMMATVYYDADNGGDDIA